MHKVLRYVPLMIPNKSMGRILLFLSLCLKPSIALDYQPVSNSVVQWFHTDEFYLPGPKNDASTTLLWINGAAHLFYNYWSIADERAYSSVATGRSIASLEVQKTVTIGDDAKVTHRWFESILPMEDGTLYGFYHSEEKTPCAFYIKSPEIGVTRSKDNGHTWENLGIIIKADDMENDCSAANGFFSNGTGDFSAVFDRDKKYVYILFSNYPMGERSHNQGIASARIAVADLASPVGKAFKWHKGSYSQPGIDGRATPFFKAFNNFMQPNPDGFWGPSVHYNNFLKKYVMLMTRTKNGNYTKVLWPTEGIYISTNDNPENPLGWSEPVKILHGGHWYPQFIGMNHFTQDNTAEMGEWARFFMEGHSDLIVRFKR